MAAVVADWCWYHELQPEAFTVPLNGPFEALHVEEVVVTMWHEEPPHDADCAALRECPLVASSGRRLLSVRVSCHPQRPRFPLLPFEATSCSVEYCTCGAARRVRARVHLVSVQSCRE